MVTQDGAGCFFAGNNGKNGELVFAHEIGHALGLGHSCGDSGTPSCADPVLNDALMRAYAHNDGRGARLGADDRAALAVLYGDGAPPCTVPAAPTGLSATAISSSRIDLTWQDRSQDEEGFAVERKLSGASSFTRIATLPAGAHELLRHRPGGVDQLHLPGPGDRLRRRLVRRGTGERPDLCCTVRSPSRSY